MKLKLGLFINLGFVISILFSCKKENPSRIPTIYGHAGASLADERAVFPPNSEASIKYALDALNADGVEVDIQMTKDSVLVIYHDSDLSFHSNLSGCVNDYRYEELLEIKYYNTLPILKLTQVLEWTVNRGKKVFLDVKPYNFCLEQSIDFEAFNHVLQNDLADYSSEEKALITVNCRKFELLYALEDTSFSRCFETENIDLGIYFCETHGIDKLMIQLGAFDKTHQQLLEEKGIVYCLDGVKTKSEIRDVLQFQPYEIITDNIAGTKKMYK